ncbi:MAG: DNA-processing protein DprA, partial [Dehalococcoidia bacterium]
FARIPRVGSKRVALLEAHFGSLKTAWSASSAELRAAGMDTATLRSLSHGRAAVQPSVELAAIERAKVRAYTWHDEEYPPRLREIHDKPPLLFVRGSLQSQDELSLAVVGTRRVSPYGRQVTQELTRGLAQNGVTVISGLARGVDALAHQAALDAGGRTIAVFACGLDIVYPPEHTALARTIAERGALVSEQPLGIRPRADYFPRRNRILSGMTLGTLIIEAGEGSGALHTANWANEQNREVFAVPGRVTSPTSAGANALIQQGMAKLVTNVSDILEELNLQMVEQQIELAAVIPEDPTQASVLRRLSAEPTHIDETVRAAGLPASTVSSTLAMLELKGLVRQVGPMLYVRT